MAAPYTRPPDMCLVFSRAVGVSTPSHVSTMIAYDVTSSSAPCPSSAMYPLHGDDGPRSTLVTLVFYGMACIDARIQWSQAAKAAAVAYFANERRGWKIRESTSITPTTPIDLLSLINSNRA